MWETVFRSQGTRKNPWFVTAGLGFEPRPPWIQKSLSNVSPNSYFSHVLTVLWKFYCYKQYPSSSEIDNFETLKNLRVTSPRWRRKSGWLLLYPYCIPDGGMSEGSSASFEGGGSRVRMGVNGLPRLLWLLHYSSLVMISFFLLVLISSPYFLFMHSMQDLSSLTRDLTCGHH